LRLFDFWPAELVSAGFFALKIGRAGKKVAIFKPGAAPAANFCGENQTFLLVGNKHKFRAK
jgi:hypothetical protein